MKHFTILFALMLLSASPRVQAQTLTLDECQQLAEANYPLIKQYDLIRQTTDYNLSNIAKGWLPQISATAQATVQSDVMHFPEPFEKMLAGQGLDMKGLGKGQYRVGLDVNQTVYDGGMIKQQKQVARAEGEVQTAQTVADLYTVRGRVNEIFFSVLLLDEKLRLNAEMQAMLQSNLEKLQSMLSNGVAMQRDVNTVMAEKLKAEQQATELTASRKSLTDMLVVFIGRPVAELAVPQETAVNMQRNNRPELRLFDQQIALTRAQENALQARLLPRLSVFAQGYYGYPGYDMFDAMFNRTWKLDAMIGAWLSWNIGALYTRKNDRAKLDTRRGLVETARETFLFNNRLQQVQQTDGIAKYQQLLADDRRIVDLRTEVRRAAESQLEHGIIDTNNLLQEITRENQARIELFTHRLLMLKESYDLKNTVND